MYNLFRQLSERVLRIPREPGPPPGDEAQTRIFLAARNYYKYLLVMWALKTTVTLLVILFILLGPFLGIFFNRMHLGTEWKTVILVMEGFGFLIAIGGDIFALALVRLDFEKRWYVVTDRSLRVRDGIVQVREATVTFANIQNISISQGPIQRLLGIADLRVDTAGGGSTVGTHGEHTTTNMHMVKFRGVDNANEIKELMQQRLRQSKDCGLGDHDDHHAPQSDVAVSSNLVAALREVHAEAQALRVAASRQL